MTLHYTDRDSFKVTVQVPGKVKRTICTVTPGARFRTDARRTDTADGRFAVAEGQAEGWRVNGPFPADAVIAVEVL